MRNLTSNIPPVLFSPLSTTTSTALYVCMLRTKSQKNSSTRPPVSTRADDRESSSPPVSPNVREECISRSCRRYPRCCHQRRRCPRRRSGRPGGDGGGDGDAAGRAAAASPSGSSACPPAPGCPSSARGIPAAGGAEKEQSFIPICGWGKRGQGAWAIAEWKGEESCCVKNDRVAAGGTGREIAPRGASALALKSAKMESACTLFRLSIVRRYLIKMFLLNV